MDRKTNTGHRTKTASIKQRKIVAYYYDYK